MVKKNDEYVRTTVDLRKDLSDKVEKFAKKTYRKKKDAINMIVDDFFEKKEKKIK